MEKVRKLFKSSKKQNLEKYNSEKEKQRDEERDEEILERRNSEKEKEKEKENFNIKYKDLKYKSTYDMLRKKLKEYISIQGIPKEQDYIDLLEALDINNLTDQYKYVILNIKKPVNIKLQVPNKPKNLVFILDNNIISLEDIYKQLDDWFFQSLISDQNIENEDLIKIIEKLNILYLKDKYANLKYLISKDKYEVIKYLYDNKIYQEEYFSYFGLLFSCGVVGIKCIQYFLNFNIDYNSVNSMSNKLNKLIIKDFKFDYLTVENIINKDPEFCYHISIYDYLKYYYLDNDLSDTDVDLSYENIKILFNSFKIKNILINQDEINIIYDIITKEIIKNNVYMLECKQLWIETYFDITNSIGVKITNIDLTEKYILVYTDIKNILLNIELENIKNINRDTLIIFLKNFNNFCYFSIDNSANFIYLTFEWNNKIYLCSLEKFIQFYENSRMRNIINNTQLTGNLEIDNIIKIYHMNNTIII